MFICEKDGTCCNYKYCGRLEDVDEEGKNCGHLVEVEPVRHGHWIDKGNGWECSACKTINDYSKLFQRCPNCGAKMDEVTE